MTTTAAAPQAPELDFEEYVRTRHDALLRSARRLVSDPSDAQDLLQTALARTYGHWDGIADKSLADAYLRRVMLNTRTQWWRSRRLDEVPTELPPDVLSVDDGTERHADRALLLDILGVLPPRQRGVVVLRHWEQLSTEETAAALGMSPGTVKSTLHRGLARLREELESRGRRERGAGGAGRNEPVAAAARPRGTATGGRVPGRCERGDAREVDERWCG
ncbi:SigE family RNA polymerase sigma factor [Streptomyces desertarenae]|uniref:RNA polymerase sigma factor n=1 Tax=Streptomyces desertarenae TaxID=2666184 RepID=A0ABW4PET8_9ACTN